MSVYVIEIAGRGIAAINADSLDEAETWFEGESFEDDLRRLVDNDGNLIRDGEQEIGIREAQPEEDAAWQRTVARERAEIQKRPVAVARQLGERSVCWLIPVTDPIDDEIENEIGEFKDWS
jgi:hypothetical protein